MLQTCISHSAAETYQIGFTFAAQLPKNSLICFFGDLGAGKTTFIQGMGAAILNVTSEQVNSPTFTYLNIYKGATTLYHFDLYRLRDADEFLSMGFDEVFDAGGITCIEWAEKIDSLIPEDAICVEMVHQEGDQRVVKIFEKGIHDKTRI